MIHSALRHSLYQPLFPSSSPGPFSLFPSSPGLQVPYLATTVSTSKEHHILVPTWSGHTPHESTPSPLNKFAQCTTRSPRLRPSLRSRPTPRPKLKLKLSSRLRPRLLLLLPTMRLSSMAGTTLWLVSTPEPSPGCLPSVVNSSLVSIALSRNASSPTRLPWVSALSPLPLSSSLASTLTPVA